MNVTLRYHIIYKSEEMEVDEELSTQIRSILTLATEGNRCLVFVSGESGRPAGRRLARLPA